MVTTIFVFDKSLWKGGAILLASRASPSRVEFHRCTVENSITGAYYKDDPQGEGGAIVVGSGTIFVLEECLLANNTAGKKVRCVSVDWSG